MPESSKKKVKANYFYCCVVKKTADIFMKFPEIDLDLKETLLISKIAPC